MSSPGGTDLLSSTKITQETEGQNFLGLAQEGERLEQFLYRNVLIAVTVILMIWFSQLSFSLC